MSLEIYNEQKIDTEFTLTFPSPRVYRPRATNRAVKKRKRRKRRKPDRQHVNSNNTFTIIDDCPARLTFAVPPMKSINFLQIHHGMGDGLYYNSEGNITSQHWGMVM